MEVRDQEIKFKLKAHLQIFIALKKARNKELFIVSHHKKKQYRYRNNSRVIL
jgi:hypothetical protein